ncbi:MAG: Ig-like domain-containing protein [Isosphaeraceae bacterium]
MPSAISSATRCSIEPATRDPTDTPAFFYTDSNFTPKYGSAAIDNSLGSLAPATDLLGAGRVDIPGLGFSGRGPADLGAFEYNGTGGQTLGGQFRVVGSSVVSQGFGFANGGSIGSFRSAPGQITVSFSGNVNKATVLPGDLVLSGNGISSSNPMRATTITWIDDHTATFGLTGSYAPGTVNLTIGTGLITDVHGNPISGFSDSFQLDSSTPVGPTPNPVDSGSPLVIGTRRRSIAVQVNRRKTVQRAGLVVSFNEAMDANSATDESGLPDPRGPQGRGKMVYNRPVAVRDVKYNSRTNQVTIVGAKNLPKGPLRLIIADSVKDSAGNALDGNRDGKAGGADLCQPELNRRAYFVDSIMARAGVFPRPALTRKLILRGIEMPMADHTVAGSVGVRRVTEVEQFGLPSRSRPHSNSPAIESRPHACSGPSRSGAIETIALAAARSSRSAASASR